MTPLLALKIAFLASVALTALFAVLDSYKRTSWRMTVTATIAAAALAAIWTITVGEVTPANVAAATCLVALFAASNVLVCSISNENRLRSPVWTSATTLTAVGVFLGACDAAGFLGAHLNFTSVIGGGCLTLAIVTAGLVHFSEMRPRKFIREHRSDVGAALIFLAAVILLAGLATTTLDKDSSFAPLSLPEPFGERSSTALLVTVLVCAGSAFCAEGGKSSRLTPAVLAPAALAAIGAPLGCAIATLAASACTIAMGRKIDRARKVGLALVAAAMTVVAAVVSPLVSLETPLAFSDATSWVAEKTAPSLSVLANATPFGWNPAGISSANNEIDIYWPASSIALAFGKIGSVALVALALATPWRPKTADRSFHRACPASLPLAAALGMLAVANIGSNLGLFPGAIGRLPLLGSGLYSILASLAAVAVMVSSPLPEKMGEAQERSEGAATGVAAHSNIIAFAKHSDVASTGEKEAAGPSTVKGWKDVLDNVGLFAGLCVLSLALVAASCAWATSETRRIDEGEMLFYVSTMESPDDLHDCRLAEYATGEYDRRVSLADAVDDGKGVGGVLLRVQDIYHDNDVVVERIWRIAPRRLHAHELYRAAVRLESACVFPGPDSSIPSLVEDDEFDKTLNDELARLAKDGYTGIKLNSTREKVRESMLAVLESDDLVVKRDGGLDSLKSDLACDGRYTIESKKLGQEFNLYFDFILDGKELRVSTIRVNEQL